MYLEDLDQLLGLFRGKCAKVTISDTRNRYESLEEMRQHVGSKISSLEIHGEQPGLHLLLNQLAASMAVAVLNELRADEATDEADALFFRTKDFLIAHPQPKARVPFVVLAIVAFVGVIIAGFNPARFNPPWFLVTLVGLVLISLFSVISAFQIGNYLTLETELNSPSYWARNREALATHTVTAAISAVVGGVIGWLVGHLR